MNTETRIFIALHAAQGEVLQERMHAKDFAEAKEIANRFWEDAVIVDMSQYNNREYLDTRTADQLFRYSTFDGSPIPRLHVIQVEPLGGTNHFQAISYYFNQTLAMKYRNLPEAEKPEIESAIIYLRNMGFNIVGYGTGRAGLPSTIVTDTFKPLVEPSDD